MSLGNIGKYGDLANKIRGYSSRADIVASLGDIGEEKYFVSLARSLEGLNVDDAVKQLSNLRINPDLSVEIIRAANDMDLLKGSTQEIEDGLKGIGAQSKGVSRLGTAFKGLWNIISAHPLISAAAAITTIATIGYSLYNKHIEKAVGNAVSAGSSWQESSDSIQSQIDKITELKTALDSGKLTEEEAYQAKSELLSIQESLTDSYGKQVEGIDLVNGSLEEQINLLSQIDETSADKFLNENKTGIDKANAEMEKNRYYYLGQVSSTAEEGKQLQDVISNYADKGLSAVDNGNGTFNIVFEGDVTQAEETLNDFGTKVRDMQKSFVDSDILESVSQGVSDSLGKANEVLDEYQDLYKQAQNATLIADGSLYGSGNEQKTAVTWLNEYSKAIEEYNNALSEGDTAKIADASEQFNTLDEKINALVSDTSNAGMSEYASQFEEVREQLNQTAIAQKQFTDALNSDQKLKVSDEMKDLVGYYQDEVENAKKSGVDLSKTVYGNIDAENRQILKWTSDNLSKFGDNLASWYNDSMKDQFATVDDYVESYLGSYSTVDSMFGNFGANGEYEIAFTPILNTENGPEYLSQDAVYSYIDGLISKLPDNISMDEAKIQLLNFDSKDNGGLGLLEDVGATAEQTSEAVHYVGALGSIQESYKEVADAAEKAGVSVDDFIKAANGETVLSGNVDSATRKIFELSNELKSLNMTDIDFKDAFETDGIQKGEDAVNSLTDAAVEMGLITGKSSEEVQKLINFLIKAGVLASNTASAISDTSKQIATDISTIATDENSAFQQATKDMESSNKGDTYDSMREMAKKAKELLKSGDVGTDDFKSIAKMFSPSGADDYENFKENLGKINRYFTEDNSGVKNFLKDLEKNDFAKYDKETKQWTYSIKDLEEAARKMGMGFEPFMAMFGELEDKGFHNDFFSTAEEGGEKLSELTQGLMQSEKELAILQQTDPKNSTAIEAKKAEIQEYKDRIDACKKSLAELLNENGGVEGSIEETKQNQGLVKDQVKDFNDTSKKKEYGGKNRDVLAPTAQAIIDAGKEAGLNYELQTIEEGGEIHYQLVLVDKDKTEKEIEEVTDKDYKAEVTAQVDTKEIDNMEDDIPDEDALSRTVELIGKDNATPIIEQWDEMDAPDKDTTLTGKDKATAVVRLWNYISADDKEGVLSGEDKASWVINTWNQLSPEDKQAILEADGTEATEVLNSILGMTGDVDVTTASATITAKDNATPKINSVSEKLDDLDGKKAITTITTIRKTRNVSTSSNTSKKETGPAGDAKGTLPAHASGTNVSKDGKLLHDETAVINELSSGGGPHKSELVVRDGKVLEFNDGYPTYADLKRGDVVLNHLQAKQLREKGYVKGSHAKIVGGESAFSNGTVIGNAYAGTGSGGGKLVGDTITSKKKTTSKKRTTTKKRTDSNNNDSKQTKTTPKKSWDSFEKWLEKLFDWIEIRLDKLSKITERWTSLAENAVNYSKKEYYYKKAISATSNEIKNNKKAEDKYRSFALQVGTRGAKAAGIDNPKQWAKSMLKNLENGVLLNSKGKVSGSAIKTYGEKKSSILDSMNEWLQKAISSKEKVQELADSYADLYESLENLANNKADEKVDKLSDALSTLETKYDLATSLTQKQSNIASQNKNAKDTLAARQTAKNTTSSSLSSAKSALKKLGFKPDGKTAIDVTAKMKPKQIQAVTRYNKALEANQTAIKNLTEAQNEYSKTIYENTHTLFTNIIDDFEYLQSIIEHKANLINKAMELNEAKGYRNSQVYYRQSLNSAQDKQNSLTDEYADAKAQLEKNLKNNPSYKGTDNYKDDLKTLHDLEEQLWDVDIEMAELQQSLNELEWDNFDKLQESISRVSDEAEFLIDELSRKELTDNDIGGLTDEGKATMALYAGNYGTAKEQVKLYADEIQKWKQELAKDPENQTLIDHIHELEDAQRDYISSVQDTKYAMIDLAKEGFEAQKQFLQDTIDKYKDLMETQEDAYEYQKTLNDMVKEINNIQKQIEVYSGDTSEENRAKLQQLNADLKDKQESLQDTQRQKLTSDINDMFDDLMDNYGDYIDDLASKLDENFDSLINAVNAGLSDTKTTIEEFAKGIGINISDELSKIQSGTDVLQNTKEGITSIVGGQQAIIDSANVNAEKIINAIHQKEEKLDNDLDKAQVSGIKSADTAKAKAAAEKAKASEAAKAKTRAEQEKAEKLKEEQAKKNANDYQKALKFIVEHFYAPKKGTKASDIKNTVKKKIYQLTGNLTVKEADLKTLAKQLGVKESNLYSKLNSLGVFKSIGKNGTVTATAKFAKGTKKVPKDMIGQVGEKGSEIVYRSADGSILTPLGENDMVFTHEMSKNLYELAKQRNIATVPGLEDSGYNKTVNNNNIQGGDVNVYLGGVTITGVQSAEELTSPAFQKQFANALKSTIKKDRNVRGLLMEVTVNEAFDKHHNSLAKNRW